MMRRTRPTRPSLKPENLSANRIGWPVLPSMAGRTGHSAVTGHPPRGRGYRVISTRVDAFVLGLACGGYVVDGASTPFFGGLRAIDHIRPVGNVLVSR